ncbi:helix-turn-helix transcriptional regulator [bacterium]|nr:helix-turn-helix transcriptional regulator [bacterium]
MDGNSGRTPDGMTGQPACATGADPLDLVFREGEALRVEDVMRVLRLSKNTVYKLARTGELPSFRVGRQLRFRYDDVLTHLGSSSAPSASMGDAAPAGSSERRANGSAGSLGATASRPQPAAVATDGADRVPLVPEPRDVLEELPSWARGSIVIGGQDLVGDILANYLAGLGVKTLRTHANAYVSLSRMYVGTCHAAVIDLWSESHQAYNTPYVRALLPGVPVIAFRLYRHRVGLTVAARNPKGIRSWADLLRPDVTLVNRPRGDGARVLLDEKLIALEATTTQVNGYDRTVTSELAQGLVVARGMADVAVTGERPFRMTRGLDFLPLQQETVDLVVLKTASTERLVKALRSLLRTDAFRGEFDQTLDDVRLMGEIIYES